MLNLSNVCLVCADTRQHHDALNSIHVCCSLCKFGQVLFFTNRTINITGAKIILISEIKTRADYSRFCIKEMGEYNIETPFILIVQHDSCIFDPDKWNDEFLKYDYVGPPWNHHGKKVTGGGGFSLRSRKLLKLMASDPSIKGEDPEDMVICTQYRSYLERNYDIKFAPGDLAAKFATENFAPHTVKTFGFHGKSIAYKNAWLKKFPMKSTFHLGNPD